MKKIVLILLAIGLLPFAIFAQSTNAVSPDDVASINNGVDAMLPFLPPGVVHLMAIVCLLVGPLAIVGRLVIGLRNNGVKGAIAGLFGGTNTPADTASKSDLAGIGSAIKRGLNVLLMLALIGGAAATARAQVVTTISTNGISTTTTNTAAPPTQFTITGGLQEIGQSIETSTNWAIWTGYGHSVSGVGRNLAFAEAAYNFNDYVGVVGGYDYLWGNGGHELNGISGGLTLQMPMHPFAFVGISALTNLLATPVAFALVSTPQGGSTVGSIAGGGVDFDLYAWGNLEIHAGVDYETRTGDGAWNGNYVAGHLAISRNF